MGKELFTFIGKSFSKVEEPEAPNRPTANFSEMYFEGNIKTSAERPGPTLITPGAYGNSFFGSIPNPSRYPVYNEALGAFALLEKPKIKVSNTIIENIEEIENVNLNQIACGFDEGARFKVYNISRERNIQISLEDDLKYFFNPALNIERYSIEASFDIRGGFKVPSNTVDVNGVDSYEYANVSNLPQNNVNIESVQFEVDEELAFKPSLEAPYLNYKDLRYNTPFIDINAKRNLASSFSFKTTFSHPHRFSKWYGNINNVNCSAIIDYINSPYNSYDGMKELLDDKVLYYEQGDIYLKLLINVTYEGEKSDGSPHEYTYMFTYKVDDIEYLDEPIYPNLPGSAGDYTQYPENLYINGASFDGSNVDGCRLEGNTYLCKAWNDVDLAGSLFIADNYNVTIHAGNEVTFNSDDFETVFESNGENAGEFNFIAEPVLDFSSPMPPQAPDQVKQFCSNTNRYKANSRPVTQGMRLADDEDTLAIDGRMEELAALEEDTSREEEEDVFMQEEFNVDIQLFPNPTSGNTKLRIGVSESTLLSVQITDLSGKQLSSPFNQKSLSVGTNELSLATNNLAAGTYLVHIIVGDQQQVVRLLKQ